VKVDLRSAGGHLANLAWIAARSFLATVFIATSAGILLAGLSYTFLREYHWSYGLLAVVAALVESLALGVWLGGKRALAMALAHGLGVLRLGRSLVRLIFERMLSVGDEDEPGARRGRITRGLEGLPLAKADDLLTRAVRAVMGEIGQGGWLRRKLHGRLLEVVRKYTLARFREEGAKHGGVDLVKMRDELEQTIDDSLVQKLRGGLLYPTALAIIGLPLVIAIQTWLIVKLAAAKSL
jgi:hypothetical protein